MADRVGDKTGPRIAQLIGQYVLAARRDHAPIEARIHTAASQALIDRMGKEIGDHFAPFINAAIDFHGDDLDPMLRTFLADSASGRHQWKAVSGILAGGASSVISTVLNNTLAPVAYQLIEHQPLLSLDPMTAAAAAAAGIVAASDAALAAARAGFSADIAQALLELSQQIPDAGQLADLVNRRLISEGEAENLLRRNSLIPSMVGPVAQLRRLLLSPADAALAVLRGNISQSDGELIAALNGMDAADFQVFIDNTGEPLGLDQLMDAERRGIIDAARFGRGFRQSRYRNEWLDVAQALKAEPMSTADAIDAAVQGHISIDRAKQLATQNGLEPADFQALYDTAGEPLSRTEMEQLFNRGLATEAEVKQAVRESRLKDKYIDQAFLLHQRLPEGRQVTAMISHGVITKQQGISLLLELGYSPEVAGFLVAEGTATKLGAHKSLTVSEIHQLHTAGVFDDAQAEQLLAPMGFDAADAGYLIRSWNLLAAAAITRQAVGVVRSKYVARHFDVQAASLYLDSLGIAPEARDRYLVTWDIERAATTRTLTEAQIVKAHAGGLIDGAGAAARLAALGYDDDDVHILLGAAPGTDLPA